MPSRPHILIVGGASVDDLRAGGESITTPGGAALYTAVAARKAGADVRFFGYKPTPLPALFQDAARGVDWSGPPCAIEDIPHFEIVYDERGDARMARASWGSEDQLDPAMVPDSLLQDVDLIHIAAIHDPSLQMKFVQALRRRTSARISAGTFGYMVHRAPDAVRALQEATDLFFLNGFEADAVFGHQTPTVRPGQILVITRGAEGADVWQGDWCTRVPVYAAKPVDLTGAGDSVCGGALAALLEGMHPVEAVRLGAAVASVTIESPGMTGLLRTSRAAIAARQERARDPRVTVDDAQVERVGAVLAELPTIRPFDFTGPHFPPVGHPQTIDWLFATMLHQFGFWSPREGRWDQPMIAALNGEQCKGSDYVFAAFKRVLDTQPELLAPRAQATLRWSDTESTFAADDGTVPVPVLANHHALARGYGRDLWELGWTPELLVTQARESDNPVQFLASKLDHISGYREDPLRKKTMLLIAALGQRPEKFLQLGDGRDLAPIIDYHLMRSCLRTGLVQVHDDALRQTLSDRLLCKPADESAVRLASYDAISRLCAVSGRDVGTVDWFFFGARKRCPEVTEPACSVCELDGVCGKQKSLFQPVLRTTFY